MKRLVPLILCAMLLAATNARAQSGGGGGPIASQHTVNGTLEGSHVFSGTKIASVTVYWSTIAARYLQIFDNTAVPGNGAFSAASTLVWCQPLTGSGTAAGNQHFVFPNPIQNFTGVTVVVSTNASNCTALTADGANDYIQAQVY